MRILMDLQDLILKFKAHNFLGVISIV